MRKLAKRIGIALMVFLLTVALVGCGKSTDSDLKDLSEFIKDADPSRVNIELVRGAILTIRDADQVQLKGQEVKLESRLDGVKPRNGQDAQLLQQLILFDMSYGPSAVGLPKLAYMDKRITEKEYSKQLKDLKDEYQKARPEVLLKVWQYLGKGYSQ